jgi:hypothetical protein
VRLLPPWDEYTAGYRDRSAILAPADAKRTVGGLAPVVAVDGRIAGTWRRSTTRAGVAIAAELFVPVAEDALAHEAERYAEHVRLDETIDLERAENGGLVSERVPMRKAINEVARDTYLREIDGVVDRWNRMLAKMQIKYAFARPSKRFNRKIGAYKGLHFTPDGRRVPREDFEAGMKDWMPSEAEKAHVRALMQPVYEPGKMAGWIAPPARGMDGKLQGFRPVASSLLETIQIYHSMPREVTDEIDRPTEWAVEYFVPKEVFEAHVGSLEPPAERRWRGNFYKCGDLTSHPHWGSWAPTGRLLNFHQPNFFQPIRFEEKTVTKKKRTTTRKLQAV